MPTYDYQCRSCEAITEVIHSMLEDGPTTCERCGGQLRRVLYPAGIIFKGSGFYKTDSRAPSSNGGSASSGAPSSGSSDAASSSSSTTDSTASPSSPSSASSEGKPSKGGSTPTPKKDAPAT